MSESRSLPSVVVDFDDRRPSSDEYGRIEVRRFAGTLRHARQLDHIRIAHLTDLHVGRVTPMRVQHAAVRLTNCEEPDLVVITGDFVGHSQLFLDELTSIIAGFSAPVVAVLGNHDYWAGAQEVRWALRRGGAEVLDNRHTVITLRGQRLQVAGLDDAYTSHASRRTALRGFRRDLPTIALSHIGEEADGLWDAGVPLVFSGHTHAGQVTLARLHELAIGRVAGHRYVHGLYGSRSSAEPGVGAVYVGAGIGAAVMPLRIGERARREITLFELGCEPGTFAEHHAEQDALQGRGVSDRKEYKRAAAVARKTMKRRRRAARRKTLPG